MFRQPIGHQIDMTAHQKSLEILQPDGKSKAKLMLLMPPSVWKRVWQSLTKTFYSWILLKDSQFQFHLLGNCIKRGADLLHNLMEFYLDVFHVNYALLGTFAG